MITRYPMVIHEVKQSTIMKPYRCHSVNKKPEYHKDESETLDSLVGSLFKASSPDKVSTISSQTWKVLDLEIK
mgnify:FL=1